MHRKTPVVPIEIDTETGVISKVGTATAPSHIPIGISWKNNQLNRGDLNDWWQGRSIPASRQNIRQAMKVLGIASTDMLPAKCFGLSLSDQYWINPVYSPLDWDEINFFDKPFSEDVGNVLFGNVPIGALNLISPNNTSDGWLKKKWLIIDGKRCLIKGGSDPFQQQPINEVMAAVIMRRLGVPHVSYTLLWENDLPYSVCENFITAETELISAYNIHNTKKIKDPAKLYEHYVDCCNGLGIPNAQDMLDKMLTIDYLIANSDRHLNNFGAVRNAVTLEWIGVAPLFDNGSSFWYNYAVAKDDDSAKSQPFLDTHEEQIKLVRNFSWLNLSDLVNIDEEFHELLRQSPLIDEARRDNLSLALRNRVKRLE